MVNSLKEEFVLLLQFGYTILEGPDLFGSTHQRQIPFRFRCIYHTTKMPTNPVFARLFGTFLQRKTIIGMQFFHRLGLVNRKPLYEPAEFLTGNVTDGLGALRPLEFTLFQAFIQENKAIAFPIERWPQKRKRLF